uniref:Tumor necrosis factor receptor type 1-associated DEATH domain protein n=1 Tax=Petromyzon marinus TaxID=7757 RepID=A0AAJ7U8Z8_PETMA|nr:tumor necrosis factor receptor type 1-associated DEATH domain protein isoform X2 [Petromyzon marinus]XP_032830463.1 tumor necrosis factor receptor type 1-associated DEATH domain protein isoform X2 [Petromyzon marinus]XP_032830464.1 tumor necrosis factor receptor type 1-associated DEATH domain protein isoform X2 [Petromyzon marinus]
MKTRKHFTDSSTMPSKVHSTLFGVDLRFDSTASCSAFLERYVNGDMEVQLNRGLAPKHQDSFTTSLQVRGEVLVKRNFDLSTWLRLIGQNEPTALQDDEVKKMQHDLLMLNLNPRDASGGDLVNSNAGPSSSCQLGGIPTHDACLSAPMVIPDNTFIFQEKLYDDRPISTDDHNNFAKKVGPGWKAVARQLMRTCKGLEDPTIEIITCEYNGVYEQAFQMLRKFMQSEAKQATLSRLVKALEDERLCNVVEFLLDT